MGSPLFKKKCTRPQEPALHSLQSQPLTGEIWAVNRSMGRGLMTTDSGLIRFRPSTIKMGIYRLDTCASKNSPTRLKGLLWRSLCFARVYDLRPSGPMSRHQWGKNTFPAGEPNLTGIFTHLAIREVRWFHKIKLIKYSIHFGQLNHSQEYNS